MDINKIFIKEVRIKQLKAELEEYKERVADLSEEIMKNKQLVNLAKEIISKNIKNV